MRKVGYIALGIAIALVVGYFIVFAMNFGAGIHYERVDGVKVAPGACTDERVRIELQRVVRYTMASGNDFVAVEVHLQNLQADKPIFILDGLTSLKIHVGDKGAAIRPNATVEIQPGGNASVWFSEPDVSASIAKTWLPAAAWSDFEVRYSTRASGNLTGSLFSMTCDVTNDRAPEAFP